MGDELDDLSLESGHAATNTEPWYDVYWEAECHYLGLGDYIQDYAEAMRLYKQAAKLGGLVAYSRLARMYKNGEACGADEGRALEYLKEGARRGRICFYWEMGYLFFNRGVSGRQNADKAFRLFVERFKNADTTSPAFPDNEELGWIASDCASVIALSHQDPTELCVPQVLTPFLSMMKARIVKEAEDQIRFCEANGLLHQVPSWEHAIQYVRDLC